MDRTSGTAAKRIGLISDTHGLLRPEAIDFLRGSNHIIHGGDIGSPNILEALGTIAAVTAVRGNNDKETWANSIQATEFLCLGEINLYAIHDLAELDIDPGAAGVQIVVSGHSHKPSISERKGVLYINPGSAGRRRFKLPITLGELIIEPENRSEDCRTGVMIVAHGQRRVPRKTASVG